MHEGRSQQSQKNDDDRTARLFAKLMMECKVRAALQLVTQANGSGPLPLNNSRKALLKGIHWLWQCTP